MRKSKAFVLIIILLMISVLASILHLTTREKVNAGEIHLKYHDVTYSVSYQDLKMEQVTGTRVNGKGEEKEVEALGILLKDLLVENDIFEYSQVTIVSNDSYKAQVSAEEVSNEEKVYLILQEEELRLIVFGDQNSKRSVSNVVQIIVE